MFNSRNTPYISKHTKAVITAVLKECAEIILNSGLAYAALLPIMARFTSGEITAFLEETQINLCPTGHRDELGGYELLTYFNAEIRDPWMDGFYVTLNELCNISYSPIGGPYNHIANPGVTPRQHSPFDLGILLVPAITLLLYFTSLKVFEKQNKLGPARSVKEISSLIGELTVGKESFNGPDELTDNIIKTLISLRDNIQDKTQKWWPPLALGVGTFNLFYILIYSVTQKWSNSFNNYLKTTIFTQYCNEMLRKTGFVYGEMGSYREGERDMWDQYLAANSSCADDFSPNLPSSSLTAYQPKWLHYGSPLMESWMVSGKWVIPFLFISLYCVLLLPMKWIFSSFFKNEESSSGCISISENTKTIVRNTLENEADENVSLLRSSGNIAFFNANTPIFTDEEGRSHSENQSGSCRVNPHLTHFFKRIASSELPEIQELSVNNDYGSSL